MNDNESRWGHIALTPLDGTLLVCGISISVTSPFLSNTPFGMEKRPLKAPPSHAAQLSKTFPLRGRLEEFSESEIQFLSKYGCWMDALMKRHIEPSTEAQRNFVEMCQGTHPPTTDHEILWRRYRLAEMVQDVEDHLAAGRLSYAEARTKMARLVKLGSSGAHAWLKKEGHWENLPSTGRSQNSGWDKGALYGITNLYNSAGDLMAPPKW